jgi:hypothetical protein
VGREGNEGTHHAGGVVEWHWLWLGGGGRRRRRAGPEVAVRQQLVVEHVLAEGGGTAVIEHDSIMCAGSSCRSLYAPKLSSSSHSLTHSLSWHTARSVLVSAAPSPSSVSLSLTHSLSLSLSHLAHGSLHVGQRCAQPFQRREVHPRRLRCRLPRVCPTAA